MTLKPPPLAVLSAGGIFGGAAVLNLGQAALPGGPAISVLPGVGAVVATVALVTVGARLPHHALLGIGMLGAALVGMALATTLAHTDAAVLYMWPAIWAAYFYGRRARAAMVVWIALVHALALLQLPSGIASVDRWLDVTAAVLVVTLVVGRMADRNGRLITRLSAEARVDVLTGLLNRRGFEERFAEARAVTERFGSSLAVVMVDLDHFKDLNDTHGHEMGDRVLAWVGSAVRDELRAGAVAARLGGDEFAVLLPDSGHAEALMVAERLRERIGRTGAASGRAGCGLGEHVVLSMSAGASTTSDPRLTAELLDLADRALYDAKAEGRDTVRARTG